ncbi:MAG TPA: aminoglycoside phosphotransferase family protein [Acidimicrobiales bacterium]|nr:aminoglycoside phosphotransferase family protein [Acidimicrobiales bacterium]
MHRTDRPGPEVAPTSVDLAAWRELDWRFALPAGELRTVAFVGPASAGEVDALRALGSNVVVIGDDATERAPATGGTADVAIVTTATTGALDGAARAVRPGGWVLVRVTAVLRPRRGVQVDTVPRWERRLRATGLGDVTTFWHAPSRATCSYIVSTDDHDGLRFVLKRWRGTRFGLAKSLVARALLRAGLFPYATRDVTVAGRAAGGEGTGPSRPLATAQASAAGADSVVLLTPWFEASRHVVAIVLRRGTPACVVKIPRRPGDDSGIRRETESLRRLPALSPAAADRAPRVLAAADAAAPDAAADPHAADGCPALVEEALAGEALGPERVRASPARALRVGMALVDVMPVTGNTLADAGWYHRLFEAPLERFRRDAPAEIRPGELVARTHERLRPLRGALIPLVFEHGDLGHPNLVLRPGGRLAALDWERSEERGLPGHDAVFLLTYLAEARRGAFAIDDRLRSFDAAFLGTAAWARDALAGHLARRQVDEALLPPLLLACWARSACGLLDRLAGSGSGSDDGAVAVDAEVVLQDRDVTLWRHVDEVYGRLL